MENVVHGIKGADIYIDNIRAFSDNWESCIKLVDVILCRMCENRFTINPLKCEWAVKEFDRSDYWLTSCGLNP
eukprot:2281249-Ditylum_brightwellii.AAC.1